MSMTTSRTRQPAKKTAAKKEAPAAKTPEPMDPGAEESALRTSTSGQIDTTPHAPVTERLCWALTVLEQEVSNLYPEATYYVSERTGRGVGIAITFENFDTQHSENEPPLPDLLRLIEMDNRIAEITADTTDDQGDNPWVSVRVRPDPVTMDTRDSFGLSAAYQIAVGGE